MWKQASAAYSPLKTLHNRWKRCSLMGVFATNMSEPTAQAHNLEILFMDATHAKQHRAASSLAV